MTKKHIFIWQSGEPLQIDKKDHNPMTAINLSEYLLDNKFKVTLISSNFDHTNKIFRFKKIKRFKLLKLKTNLNLVLIDSLGYKKNISIKRLIDHFILAVNLNFFLKQYKGVVDFAILGFPPIETPIIFSNWLSKKKIPYIFHVKDLWPEYFYERIQNKFISFWLKIFFTPYDMLLKKSLKRASGIFSNNKFFLNFILKKIKRKKMKNDKITYLTKPIINTKSKKLSKKINFNKNQFNIYFCGRLDLEVFDFITVFKAFRILNKNELNFHFYIAGYGQLDKLRGQVNKYKLQKKITLLGYTNKYDHSIFLNHSDLFLAPFYNNLNFSSNLSNKFVEAIQHNLPILTPLKKDVSKFIIRNNIGGIYIDQNPTSLAKELQIIFKKLKKNSLIKNSLYKLSNGEFDHKKNYSKFLNTINHFQ